MNITYQKLTEHELDLFIKMRIEQLREEGAKEEIDLMVIYMSDSEQYNICEVRYHA